MDFARFSIGFDHRDRARLHELWDGIFESNQWSEGELTRGWAVYRAPYEGPPGCLHGGFVAAAFDDLLGWAQMASGKAGFTGTLTIKMRRPTPLEERIDYEAGVDRVQGRKIWCWGKSRCGSQLLAEALVRAGVEVHFVPVPGAGHGGREFSSPPNRKLVVDFFDRHL